MPRQARPVSRLLRVATFRQRTKEKPTSKQPRDAACLCQLFDGEEPRVREDASAIVLNLDVDRDKGFPPAPW